MPTQPLRIILTIVMIIIVLVATSIVLYVSKEITGTITMSLGKEFQLKIIERTFIREVTISITFVRVVEDTRYPVNVYFV